MYIISNYFQEDLNQVAKLKQKPTTFKIGMSSSTKVLLIKRDFQLEYEQLLTSCKTSAFSNKLDPTLIDNPDASEHFQLEKKLFLYHQIYTLYLLCVVDYERLLELNDLMLKEPVLTAYHSRLVEFYLVILNLLFYKETAISKFIYKAKLFAIVRSLVIKRRAAVLDADAASASAVSCTKSFLSYLQHSLVHFTLHNSAAFVTQLLENNDLELLFDQISIALASASTNYRSSAAAFSLGFIFTSLLRLEAAIEAGSSSPEASQSILASNLGLQHKIRRQFDAALKLNPRSFELWFFYLKFEVVFRELEVRVSTVNPSRFENRVLSIYYQSIRNLPNLKVAFN